MDNLVDLVAWFETPFAGHWDGVASVVAFLVVSIVSFWALLDRFVKLNPEEWIGTLVIGVWSAMRIPAKLENMDTLAVNLLLHAGLFLIACGAIRRRVQAWRWRKTHGMESHGFRALSSEEMNQVYGRGKH